MDNSRKVEISGYVRFHPQEMLGKFKPMTNSRVSIGSNCQMENSGSDEIAGHHNLEGGVFKSDWKQGFKIGCG